MRFFIVIFTSFVLLLTQTGCATISTRPLSEETRTKLGNIGVVSAAFIPESNLLAFAKGRTSGAATGFAGGTLGGAAGGALALLTSPLAGSLGIFLGPVLLICAAAGAVTGGLYGTVEGISKSIPEEKAKEIETALTNALAELKAQEVMRSHFLKVASDETLHHFILIEEPKPKIREQKINYSSLTENGINTVLELSVLAIDFEGKGGDDPLLALLITVRTKLIRLADGSVLYANYFKFRSAERKLSYWLQNNAEPFMKELEHAYQSLSEKIVEELFLIYDIP